MGLEPGATLGRYRILAPLGAGGMGEVYRARDERLEREVAIKVLPAHLAQDAAALARFQNESKALAALAHANLLAIFDFGEEGGVCFAVTELLEGETLRTRLLRGRIEWRDATRTAGALADALAAAHERHIIHRDVKPENIFLTQNGTVKLLDFGLARTALAMTAVSDSAPTLGTALSQPGLILGTPGYLAPEQARGEAATPASDLFALGCVLYEMLSGRRAFGGSSLAECLSAVLERTPAPLTTPGATLPPELGRLIEACLEKAPARRLQSARDLSLRLQSLLSAPEQKADSQAVKIESIAVLPWVNVAGDQDAEYLCEGVPENIMNTLARLPGLRVAPRSLSFRKGAEADALTLGRELGVGAVLSGRLQQRAGMLIVGVELSDVGAGAQIWGERLRRPAGDLFALEEEIAAKVCEGLRVRLSGGEQQRREQLQPADAEAYALYLRGRQAWRQRRVADLAQAAGLFQQAIERDPGYALAYAGLADCYMMQAVLGLTPFRHTVARGRAAAGAALAMNPDLGEAHSAMANVLAIGLCQWEDAEQEYRRAMELDPRLWMPSYYLSMCLRVCGRDNESLQMALQAVQVEPAVPLPRFAQSWALRQLGRDEECIASCEEAIREGLDHPYLRFNYALSLEKLGRSQSALEMMAKLPEVTGRLPIFVAGWGWLCAQHGKLAETRSCLEAVLHPPQGQPVELASAAILHVALGETDAAMAALSGIGANTAGMMTLFVREQCYWDPVRARPEFQAMLERMRLR